MLIKTRAEMLSYYIVDEFLMLPERKLIKAESGVSIDSIKGKMFVSKTAGLSYSC